MKRLRKQLERMPHPVRWALSMIIGFTLLLLGLIMLVTPGPGLLLIFFGLSILALELEWAREINKQGMQGLERIVARVKRVFIKEKKTPKEPDKYFDPNS